LRVAIGGPILFFALLLGDSPTFYAPCFRLCLGLLEGPVSSLAGLLGGHRRQWSKGIRATRVLGRSEGVLLRSRGVWSGPWNWGSG